MKINEQKVKEFWNWFNLNSIFLENTDQKQIQVLDRKISELGDFGWEIGPGLSALNALTISPNGNKALLPYTKEVIKMAPEVPNWEFRFAKPKKEWQYVFTFDNELGNKIEIDAKNWQYVLFEFPDNTYDIVIEAKSILNLNPNEKLYAAEIVLDSILGEEKCLELIQNIEVVDRFDDDLIGKKSDIYNLDKHINAL